MKNAVRFVACTGCLLSLFIVTCFAYSDSPPSDAPFTGGLYISGITRELGNVTVYIPSNYQSGYLGLNDSGNLFNASSSSITGLVYAGSTQYTFRISAWSTPQYRALTGSTTYYDLTFTSIDYSNADIADEFSPLVSVSDVVSYLPIIFLGGILLCLFMKRF